MDRKELKSKLKELHSRDWKECLEAMDEFTAVANYRAVQEVTEKYVKLVKEFNSLEDDAHVNDLLMDIEIYKLGLALIHLIGDKSLGVKECYEELCKSMHLLRKLVVPTTYRQGIPLSYTAERIKLDINNMQREAQQVSKNLSTIYQ